MNCAGIGARVLTIIIGFLFLPVHTSPAHAQDDFLRLFFWQAPTIINPHLSAGTKDLSASRISYEPLASFNAEGELVPFLAAEIPSIQNGGVAEDGRSVTWRLKRGIKWSDGRPYSADDVLFTYQYIPNPQVLSLIHI